MELAVHSRAERSGSILIRSAHKDNGTLPRGMRQDAGFADEKRSRREPAPGKGLHAGCQSSDAKQLLTHIGKLFC